MTPFDDDLFIDALEAVEKKRVADRRRFQYKHVDDIATTQIPLTAQTGDRLILAMSEQDVDADSPVAISLNKRMYVGGATDDDSVTAYLKTLITVKTDVGEADAKRTDITEQVKFSADSDAHRITLDFGSSLHLSATRSSFRRISPTPPAPATRPR